MANNNYRNTPRIQPANTTEFDSDTTFETDVFHEFFICLQNGSTVRGYDRAKWFEKEDVWVFTRMGNDNIGTMVVPGKSLMYFKKVKS